MGRRAEAGGRGPGGRGGIYLPGALAALLVWALLGLARPALGENPRLADVVVIGKDSQVLLFSTLEGAFSKELLEAVQSGVPATFEYTIELMRARRFWYDERVSLKRVFHGVKFDALKKEYAFTSTSGEGVRYVKVTKDAEEMRDWMMELNGEAIALRGELRDGNRYYVRVKADLNSPHFAFPLSYLLFFLSRETPWTVGSPFTPGDL